MNENEIELCVKILMQVLGAIKDECEANCNCNSCLLKKECCILEGVPTDWDLDIIEERIRQIIEIESKIKERRNEKN